MILLIFPYGKKNQFLIKNGNKEKKHKNRFIN